MKIKKNKLRILFICQNFWPENFRSTDVVENLIQNGNHVEIITSNPNYPEGKIYKGYNWYNWSTEIYNKKIKVHRVPTIPRGKSNYFFILINYVAFIIFGTLFGFLKLRKNNFDIVLVFAASPIFQVIVGYFMKLFFKTKLVTWVQDIWPENLHALNIIKNKYLLNFINILTTLTYNLSDVLIGQSESFKKILKKRSNKKTYFIPNYSENFKFNNSVKRQQNNKYFNLVYAGNVGKAQNLLTLIKASKKVRNKKRLLIKIFGDGVELRKLKKFINDNDLKNIKLFGKVSRERMYLEYKKANALYISLNKNKFLNYTIPSKLQTYLIMSKPIIASAGGEIEKIIYKSKAGYCSKPENVNLLAENLNKILSCKKEQLKIFEKNAKKFYEQNYSSTKITHNMMIILNKYKKNV